ncbi:MAG: NFACT family protein [Armatimonadota bacterium]|nr:NFACT family protein [Armatimonadota bacterium]MDR7449442.1 NFACT family protein [Armatimonadota bacterium]MDR7458815.1 NFACT family protein [Armatimonadota bacterium]MDR7480031.1 NFACT family protein [Armatimonadota bacterium]MDR7488447.1 NFACT family protein [Armatimonadota bacterium]
MSAAVAAYDSLVLAAVAVELEAMRGARVVAVHQPEPEAVALLLRGRQGTRGLWCSIHPRWARVVLAPAPSARPTHPFPTLLRARLDGARLVEVTQPAFERVLTLTFEALEGRLDLVAEVMGRHANLLLLDGRCRVVGIFKPVTPAMSRVRPLGPGATYTPPPVGRARPEAVTPDALARWLAAGRPVAATLVAHLVGVSPPVAAHLALAAGCDPEQAAPPDAAPAVHAALGELIATVTARAFRPSLYEDDAGEPVAFSAIPLAAYRHLRRRDAPSMSAAVETVVARLAGQEALRAARQALLARLGALSRRVHRALEEARAQLQRAEGAETYRRFGELLLAHAHALPRGAREVTVPDFDGRPTTITLDPQASAVANAQAYFRRYRKAAAGRPTLQERVGALEAEAAFLEQVRVLAEQAEDLPALAAVAQDLTEGEGQPVGTAGRGARRGSATPRRVPLSRRGRSRPPGSGAPAPATGGPRRFTAPGGFAILVGRSHRENDRLTFEVAAPHDLWLHARGMPGAHVILRTGGRRPSEAAVQAAAAVAAYYSRGRGAARVAVDVTERRHVHRLRGGRPGMVTYTGERTLTVEPALPAGAPAQERTTAPPRPQGPSRTGSHTPPDVW